MAMEFFKKIETRIAMHCNGLLDQVLIFPKADADYWPIFCIANAADLNN